AGGQAGDPDGSLPLPARLNARTPERLPPGAERRFLCDLPVEVLWDLKPEMLRRLRLLGLRTLGQVAALPARTLAQPLGPAAYWYRNLARGVDRRTVRPWRPAPAQTAACAVERHAPRQEPPARCL